MVCNIRAVQSIYVSIRRFITPTFSPGIRARLRTTKSYPPMAPQSCKASSKILRAISRVASNVHTAVALRCNMVQQGGMGPCGAIPGGTLTEPSPPGTRTRPHGGSTDGSAGKCPKCRMRHCSPDACLLTKRVSPRNDALILLGSVGLAGYLCARLEGKAWHSHALHLE